MFSVSYRLRYGCVRDDLSVFVGWELVEDGTQARDVMKTSQLEKRVWHSWARNENNWKRREEEGGGAGEGVAGGPGD